MKEYIKSKLGLLASERGQSIIILALAVMVLLAFVGIAIDVGLLYGLRIQLSRAVDAAALAGALELPDLDDAQVRARQFMRTNGFDPDGLSEWDVDAGGGAGLGQSNYLTVTAQLPMDTMFLRFVGFPTVEVPAMAVAEFKSPIEVYASQNAESGVAGVVNLNIFGQDGNPAYGDAFSPLFAIEKPGQSCSCASPCSNDDWRTLLQGRNGMPGVYPFRIHVPADYVDLNGGREIQVEILDPDDCNDPANSVLITHLDVDGGGTESKNTEPGSTSQSSVAMAATGDGQNPKWFVRMDQNCDFCGGWGTYSNGYGVETQYTLYYYKLNDRTVYEIAQYTIKDTLCSGGTDLEWVIPTGFSFDLDSYPDVWTDENGNKSFYLDVEGIDGTGGNGYDLWAGPPPTVTLPTNVNERNVYLINEINDGNNRHSSGGVGIWAIGFLPLNVNTNTTYTITLSYIPPEAAGTSIRISNFDLDRDTRTAWDATWGDPPDPILGTTPTCGDCRNIDYHQCFGKKLYYLLEGVPIFYEDGDVSCSSLFGSATFTIPHEFYGGYLYAVFQTGRNDTTDWMLEYLDVVDSTYVRLIK